MNPLLQAALSSILRALLAGAAGWFVNRGIWTADAANEYLAAAVLAIITLVWSLWAKYKDRIKFLTALESPAGASEKSVEKSIKRGTGATLTTLALAVALAASVSACGGTIRDQIRTSALVVGDVALSVDAIEQDIAKAQPPVYASPAQAEEVNRGVLGTLQAARAYERAVRAWPAGAVAVPRDVWEAQTAAINAIVKVEGVLTGLPAADKLLANLRKLRELIGG